MTVGKAIGYAEVSLDEFEEEKLLRRQVPSRHYHRYMRQMNRGILSRLETLTNSSWLSIPHQIDLLMKKAMNPQ